MKILVTGGAGYIGSHFVDYVQKNSDHEIAVLDNLSRGHSESIPANVVFFKSDLMDKTGLQDAINSFKPEAIVHFAAFAYVGESVENPEMYYQNNVVGSVNLISAASRFGVDKFIFSSTCSLYGNPENVPISENENVKPINPYAKTKMIIEETLKDFETYKNLRYFALRYFNAAGADPDGRIGESHDPEPHLIPIVLNTAMGKREKVMIFGDDYNTPDGTCIRDYIHVNDLAKAHLQALSYLVSGKDSNVVNLGTGNGSSVKEIISATERITGKKVNFEIAPRRAGDPGILVADNKKAGEVLNWTPDFGLDEIILSAWNWHNNQKF